MTTLDIRSRIIAAMRAHLESKPITGGALAIGVDLAALTDIALDTITEGRGVPLIPRYDAALFAELRETQPLDVEEVSRGSGFPTLAVDRAGDDVRFVLVDTRGEESVIALGVDSAERHALATLSVVAAVRQEMG